MRAFTVIDAEQRSDAWFAARVGRLTGSNAGKMLVGRNKDGSEKADRRNLRVRLILERLTNKPQESTFQSQAMKDGIEREPLAIAAYEAQTGLLLEATGFLSHNELMIGASLDGHLGDFETLISIKCRQPAAHWEYLRHGIIPADALAQMRHECWLTGATEHRYVSWNPDFRADQQLKFTVLQASKLDIPQYEAEALKFLAEVDEELKIMDGWKAEAAGVA